MPAKKPKKPAKKASNKPIDVDLTPKEPKKAPVEKNFKVKHYLPAEKRVVISPAVAPAGRPEKPRTDEELVNMPWSRADRVEGRADKKLAAMGIEDIAVPTREQGIHTHGWREVSPTNSTLPMWTPPASAKAGLRQLTTNWGRQLQASLPDMNFRVTKKGAGGYAVEAAPKICADCDPNNPNRTEEVPRHSPI